VHAWDWPFDPTEPAFRGRRIIEEAEHETLEKHILVAYGGVPHVSSDINGRWVQDFVSGKDRKAWHGIVSATKEFIKALRVKDWTTAVNAMNREVEIRRTMTPDVLDDMGSELLMLALEAKCGARFAGAGGGGCMWAIGTAKDIDTLRPAWESALSKKEGAHLLDTRIDARGLEVSHY
jgi:D-glycero-alpha-D-manno-heptose-7-phosphate kinase